MKASVLDKNGRMLHDRLRVDTPKKVTPRQLVGLIAGLIPTLPRFDRVSVGFPGVVRNGVVLTAPNLGTDRFHRFNLARALERRLGKPVRVENDADVQGLAVVKGKGVEMVITLGTGFGSSIFIVELFSCSVKYKFASSHFSRIFCSSVEELWPEEEWLD